MLLLQLVLGLFLSAVICQENEFWIPVTPEQVLTIDMQDKIRFELDTIFKPSTVVSLRSVKMYMKTLVQNTWEDSDSLVIQMQNETSFQNSDYTVIYSFEFFYNQSSGAQYLGKFRKFCVFAVSNPNEPDFSAHQDRCLPFHIRVVDSRASYNNLSSFTNGEQQNVSIASETQGVNFNSLFRGLLPKYLGYVMSCSSADGDKTKYMPSLNHSQAQAFAASETINHAQFEGFKGTNQTYIDGFVMDYSLPGQKFRLLRVGGAHPLVQAVKTNSVCLKAEFVSVVTGTHRYVVVLCQAATKLEAIQLMITEVMSRSPIDPTPSLQFIASVQQTEVDGEFDGCSFVGVSSQFICTRPSSGSTGHQNYSVITLENEPLNIEITKNLSTYVLAKKYASLTHQDLAALKSELIPVFQPDLLYLKLTDSVKNDTKLVTFEQLGIVFQDNTNSTGFQFEIKKVAHLDPKNLSDYKICQTLAGIFLIDENARQIWLIFRPPQQKMMMKDLSNVEGDLHSYKCFPQQGAMLAHFFTKSGHNTTNYKITSMLLNGWAIRDAGSREIAELVYYHASNPITGNPFWLTYFDYFTNQICWYAPWSANVEANHTSLVNSRLCLSIDQNPTVIQTNDTGTFNCQVFGLQISNHSLPRTKIALEIKVFPQSGMAFDAVLRNSSTSLVRYSIPGRKTSLNHTIELEDIMSIQGPVLSNKLYVSPKPTSEEAQLSLVPRIKLKYTVRVGPKNQNYTRLLWVHENLIVGVRQREIDLLVLNPVTKQYEVNSTVDYYSYKQYWTSGISTSTEFNNLDSLDFVVNDADNPTRLLLYGISEVVEINLDPWKIQRFHRLLVTLMISLPSFELLASCTMPVSFDCPDIRQRAWGFIEMRQISLNLEPLKYQIIFHFLDLFNRQRLGYDMILYFLTYDENGSFWRITNWEVKQIATMIPNTNRMTVEVFSDKDPNNFRLKYLFDAGGRLSTLEYLYQTFGNQSWPYHQQMISVPSYSGKVVAFNCSRTWHRCVVALDTNELLTADYQEDPDTNIWIIGRLQASPIGQQVPWLYSQGHVEQILFSDRFMVLLSDVPGSRVLVYTNDSLDQPAAILPEQYMTRSVVSFGKHCTSLPHTDTKNCTEYIIHGQNSSSASVYTLGGWQVRLVNYSVEQLSQGVDFTVSFNDPQLSDTPLPSSLHRNVSFRFQLSPSSTAWLFTSTGTSSSGLLVAMAVLCVLLGVWGLNFVHYKLTVGNEIFEEPALPLEDYDTIKASK